jgi:hypothetical protein
MKGSEKWNFGKIIRKQLKENGKGGMGWCTCRKRAGKCKHTECRQWTGDRKEQTAMICYGKFTRLCCYQRQPVSLSEANQCWLLTSSTLREFKSNGRERGDADLSAIFISHIFIKLNKSFPIAAKRRQGSAKCGLWAKLSWLLFLEISYCWSTAMPICIQMSIVVFAPQWQS